MREGAVVNVSKDHHSLKDKKHQHNDGAAYQANDRPT